MSGVHVKSEPLIIFGDRVSETWGLIIGGERPTAAVGELFGDQTDPRPINLDISDEDVWTATGQGLDLRVERAEATTSTEAEEYGLQPCQVTGTVAVAGSERHLDVGGVRAPELSQDGLDSLRMFGSWFPTGQQCTLIAARPRGAKGHDRDRIEVVARGEEHALVFDPRLSTTYDSAGVPARVGLELWLGDDPEGDQLPRRLAGLMTGSHVADRRLTAYAVECTSRGERGAGIYLLARG